MLRLVMGDNRPLAEAVFGVPVDYSRLAQLVPDPGASAPRPALTGC